jgi:signal transduction histidine kinase
MVTKDDGTILAANDTLCAWLERPRDELIGARLDSILPVGVRLFRQTHLVPLLQLQGSVGEVQLDLKRSNGELLPVLTTIRRTRDPGEPRRDEYAFMVTHDRRKYELELLEAKRRAELALDERNSALAALEQKQQEMQGLNLKLRKEHESKDRFMAVLAHELRNPLAPLRSGLDLLNARGLGRDPLTGRTLEVLDRQVGFISHLVEDLMDSARIGEGKLALRLEPVKLSGVVRQAVEISRPKFEQNKQRLDLMAGEDCIVQGDLFRLTQVVTNLLTNASKYTPAGGNIALAYDRLSGTAIIRVSDDGIGIRPERLASVFDMFAQEEAGSDRSEGGLGIGLALVKGLVCLHQGEVHAQSEGLGRGSVFTVRLPAVG